MGGLAVNKEHQTNIKRLYAIGECASMYHGANRLGGNSLLAAIRSGNVAANSINGLEEHSQSIDFNDYINTQKESLKINLASQSKFSAIYIRYEIAKIMDNCLGITRNEEKLRKGIEDIEYYIGVSDQLNFDSDVSFYVSYSLKSLLVLAKAILLSALERKETRGAHIRIDYPSKNEEYSKASYISYMNGSYKVEFIKE
jgi:succinate dehydrogenase / fumarate reductase flavoprotein subunit